MDQGSGVRAEFRFGLQRGLDWTWLVDCKKLIYNERISKYSVLHKAFLQQFVKKHILAKQEKVTIEITQY